MTSEPGMTIGEAIQRILEDIPPGRHGVQVDFTDEIVWVDGDRWDEPWEPEP